MRELILNGTDIIEFFATNDFDEMLVTTEKHDDLFDHEELEWETVVEFGVNKVVTSPFAYEYSKINYDEITAICVRFDGGIHDDSVWVVNHNTERRDIVIG